MNEISESDQVETGKLESACPTQRPGGQYHGECGSSTDRTLEFSEDEKNLL